jgi:uncharacterized membrane protein
LRGQRDLERVCLAAIVCALAAILLPWEAVRLVAALPLAVFLPGYAIVAAAFAPRQLDSQRMTMLMLACGLSVLCLGGILLDPLPGGLRTVTWALLLVLVVIGASRGAALRRTRRRPKRSVRWAGGSRREQLRRAGDAGRRRARSARRAGVRIRPANAICGALAVVAVAAALLLAYTPLPAGDAAGYTALWMLPGQRQGPTSVRVGVASAEQGSALYHLQVRSGKGKRLRSYDFALAPGDERVFKVPVNVNGTKPTRVAASLYKRSDPGRLYRRVTTWLRPGTNRR